MQWIRGHSMTVVTVGLLLVGSLVRWQAYGDLRLSVGNAETQSYIESSRAPLFSWDSFAGTRLLTTNLIYKLANDPARCPLTALSNPAEGDEVSPTFQTCLDSIAVLQGLLSIFGWCYLGWTAARWMRHPATRIGVLLLVMAFAFTPQIAEWDSILSPESLSMSLFAISLALLMEMAFRGVVRKEAAGARTGLALLVAWVAAFSLWVFVRDVHLYAILTTLAWLAALFLLGGRHAGRRVLPAVIVFLAGIFILGSISARESHRATRYPLIHAVETYVLPFPSRLDYFKRLGMPDPTSPGYLAWMDDNATGTYASFLMSHPGFVVTTLWENRQHFGVSFLQQYYSRVGSRNEDILLGVGEIMHPETDAVYLIVLLLFGALCITSLRTSDAGVHAWTLVAAWVAPATLVILMASFFGDAEAYRRHMFASVETFRLMLWLLILAVMDVMLAMTETRGTASKRPAQQADTTATDGGAEVHA
jgi:hypothetical protein